MRQAFINLYVSGFFHRMGKPNQFNVHPGDLYPTRAAAEDDVSPTDLYIGTVEVLIPDDLQIGEHNPPWSQPEPLEKTKEYYKEFGAIALLTLALKGEV